MSAYFKPSLYTYFKKNGTHRIVDVNVSPSQLENNDRFLTFLGALSYVARTFVLGHESASC